MIELTEVAFQLGTKVLLNDANLTIFAQHKVGIIGRNGCGKTSLFKLITKQEQVDQGHCQVPKQWRIGHVKQETPAVDVPAIDYVMAGDEELMSLHQAEKNAETQGNHQEIANIHQKIEDINGYTASARAGGLLHGLGFSQDQHHKPVREFSGGWRMRLNLAQALMCRADLLLLDEPTNHLDISAIVWLESWLKAYPGTLLIISHDRNFLDNVVTSIVHIEHQQLKLYSGNYSRFENTRAMQIELAKSQAEKAQKKREQLNQFITRFKAKASKAKQAQSRIKMLEKMGDAAVLSEESPFQFSFFDTDTNVTQLLSLNEGTLGYAEKKLISSANLTLQQGDRIGLLGSNGAGKSTLLKSLAGKTSLLSGEITLNKHCHIGYFDQHQLEALDLSASVYSHVQRLSPSASEQTIRNFVGGFAFHGDTVFEPITHFSGGEKARLALALVVWQKPNLLLLDEPTNHLDIEARTALSLALQNFSGAIVTISHDRHLLDAICDQFYLIENGCFSEFKGSLDDYQQYLNSPKKADSPDALPATSKAVNRKDAKRIEAQRRQELAPLNKQCQKFESRNQSIDTELTAIHEQLADSDIYSEAKKELLQALMEKERKLKEEKENIEEKWLEALDEIEAIKAAWDSED